MADSGRLFWDLRVSHCPNQSGTVKLKIHPLGGEIFIKITPWVEEFFILKIHPLGEEITKP